MAENDAMEGKKLELHMFEQKILETVELAKKQRLDTGVIDNGVMPFEIKIEKVDKKIKIHAFGEEILTLENGESFNYNIEGLKNIQEKLAKNPEFDYRQFGLPDLEYLEELEKQKEERQKDEKDLSDDIEEKDKDKEESEPEEEGRTEDEAKEEIARRYRVSPNQVVHISTSTRSKRVTDKDHFSGIAKWAKQYDDIFILPGKDEYSWETIGVDKEGKEEVINNRQLEGKNPDVTIKMENQNSSNEEIEEVRPLAMYKIDTHTSYAIVRDNAGKTQAVLCRQEEGKGKEYWGQVIPEAQGKNVREASPESREAISPEHYSAYDLAKRGQAFEAAKSLEERGYPSKEGKGVQMEEITGTPAQNRELSKEAIIKDLADRVIAASSMPINRDVYIKIHQEELSKKAEKILTMGEEHDDITYEDALKEIETQSKEAEEDQKTPDQNPRRRGH